MTKPFTKAQRLQVFEAFGALVCCQVDGCEAVMCIKGCQIDHHLADIFGGKHELENWRPICDAHHREKSAAEHIANSKMKRVSAKHSNPKPAGKIKGRGFSGHRKMNGEIVWKR